MPSVGLGLVDHPLEGLGLDSLTPRTGACSHERDIPVGHL